MTQQELIAYRKELISLGRTPKEIYAALARNTSPQEPNEGLISTFSTMYV